MLGWSYPLYGSHFNLFSFDLCVFLTVSYGELLLISSQNLGFV